MINLLIVEDNETVADLIADLVTANGYEVSGIARTVAEAVAIYEASHPEYAIVDLHLADDIRGTELLRQLGRPTCMGILFASDDPSGMHLTSSLGTGFIRKPFHADHLLSALEVVIEICLTGSSLLPFPPGFRVLEASGA